MWEGCVLFCLEFYKELFTISEIKDSHSTQDTQVTSSTQVQHSELLAITGILLGMGLPVKTSNCFMIS